MSHRPSISKRGGRRVISPRETVQYQRRAASPDKLALLDDTCRKLYIFGLQHHQGKGFAEIYQGVREWVKSERTLDKHLKHLRLKGFVKREPERGGRGCRGRYFFQPTPPPVGPRALKKSLTAIARKLSEDLPPAGAPLQVQAEALADEIEALYLTFGLSLASLLERSLFYTSRRETIPYFIRGSKGLDEAVDDMALCLLLVHRGAAREALRIFQKRLRDRLVPLGSAGTQAAAEQVAATDERAEWAAAPQEEVSSRR